MEPNSKKASAFLCMEQIQIPETPLSTGGRTKLSSRFLKMFQIRCRKMHNFYLLPSRTYFQYLVQSKNFVH